MSDRVAKVEDLDALKSMKRAVWKFAETANSALTDAESEMHRALMWLENEQRSYWDGQARKRADLVERAKEAVRMKRLFKDSTGRQQSAVDEEKALRLAVKRLEEAQEKQANVKKYTQKLRKEILMYKGHVQRFATSVQNELPMASAQLDGLLDRLQRYVALDAPEEVRSSAGTEVGSAPEFVGAGGSMSRGQPAEDAKREPTPSPQESSEHREETKPAADDPAKSA